MQAQNSRPPVLCIGGLDPSGGAGLQADIESIAACGGHALPIASCLTIQNSTQAFSVSAVDPALIEKQASVLFEDIHIASCKIGVIPNEFITNSIASILAQLANAPVVFDPVLAASQGSEFSDLATIKSIKNFLLPAVTIVTPNTKELNMLIDNNDDITAKAQSLCKLGPEWVLVTGADCDTDQVHNTLFSRDGIEAAYQWPRLPHTYHGSGCTLSSAIACYLAVGCDIFAAIEKAQQFTWQSLKHALPIGRGQWIPNRMHQANN